MELTANIIFNAYSMAILAYIGFYSRNSVEGKHHQQAVFQWMVFGTALLLIIDILSRMEGYPGTLYEPLHRIGNFLIFFMSPILPSLWLIYAHSRIFPANKLPVWIPAFTAAVLVANTALVACTQVFGWYYHIDTANQYARGPLFYVPAIITVGMIVLVMFFIIANRRHIDDRHLFSLLFFPVIPLASVFLQIFIYGISFMLNGLTLSLLIVYFGIQHRTMNTDYLTGVFNRKKLDAYLKGKIHNSTEEQTFAAIMIDLDNFKFINDTYGHDVGDRALEAAAKLLKSCLRKNDLAARYGGDEFYLVLDISDEAGLAAAIDRIDRAVEDFNAIGKEPYRLSFSMGYAVYDIDSTMTVEEFKRRIDCMMYKTKLAKKSVSPA